MYGYYFVDCIDGRWRRLFRILGYQKDPRRRDFRFQKKEKRKPQKISFHTQEQYRSSFIWMKGLFYFDINVASIIMIR